MTKPPSIIVAELLAKLSEAERQRDRLAEALRSYAECGDGCTCGDGWSHDIARAALADLDK